MHQRPEYCCLKGDFLSRHNIAILEELRLQESFECRKCVTIVIPAISALNVLGTSPPYLNAKIATCLRKTGVTPNIVAMKSKIIINYFHELAGKADKELHVHCHRWRSIAPLPHVKEASMEPFCLGCQGAVDSSLILPPLKVSKFQLC